MPFGRFWLGSGLWTFFRGCITGPKETNIIPLLILRVRGMANYFGWSPPRSLIFHNFWLMIWKYMRYNLPAFDLTFNSGILSIWHIFWHPIWHPCGIYTRSSSGILSGISSAVCSGIRSGILSDVLFWHYLASILTFFSSMLPSVSSETLFVVGPAGN